MSSISSAMKDQIGLWLDDRRVTADKPIFQPTQCTYVTKALEKGCIKKGKSCK